MTRITSRKELAERLKDILAVEIKAREAYQQDILTFQNFVITDTITKIREDEEKHIRMLEALIRMLEQNSDIAHHEKSCGAIIYVHKRGHNLYLVTKSAKNHHWDFPHGRIEENETEEMTARREVHEETGLSIRFEPKFRERIEYKTGPNATKEVINFVGEATSEAVTLPKNEVSDYAWLTFDEALGRLTHEESRQLLAKANEFLTGAKTK